MIIREKILFAWIPIGIIFGVFLGKSGWLQSKNNDDYVLLLERKTPEGRGLKQDENVIMDMLHNFNLNNISTSGVRCMTTSEWVRCCEVEKIECKDFLGEADEVIRK